LYHPVPALPIDGYPGEVRKRWLLLVGIAAAALAAWLAGLHEHLEIERLRELIAGAGPWGPALFVLLFGAQGLGLPGFLFIGAALLLWPVEKAFVLIWLGSVAAGCVGFAFARSAGRGFVAAHMPGRFRSLDERLATSGLKAVLLVRVVFYLAAPAHWALGLSAVPFRTMLLGSIVGFLPPAALWSFAGGSALAWANEQTPVTWLAALAAVALLLAARHLWRRRRLAARAEPGIRPGPTSSI
jgi:uncharacterized membrane protein YdjX (TVP38/TMEM64 family)